MMDTPLYDQLTALAQSEPLRLHMPGHKGKGLPGLDAPGWAALDVTELTPTGNLFFGGDVIEQAETLWAQVYGGEHCLFLTGGSTQGIHTAVHLCCRPGQRILADRGSHRALWNALALLDCEPVFLPRPWLAEEGITGAVSPEAVEQALTAQPDVETVFLTSPTYYGVCSDIRAIGEICHTHGVKLVVDCAHGAHFPFVGMPSPAALGADVSIFSAHKTLPAPGQSAFLVANGFSQEDLCRSGAVYGSSSPSYAMMGALDRVRAFLLQDQGYARLAEEHLPAFARALAERTHFTVLHSGGRFLCDPVRLVIGTRHTGRTGFATAQLLEEQGIYCEMADNAHLVCILTCADGAEELNRLLEGLARWDQEGNLPQLPPPPEVPQRVVSLRTAMFAPRTRKPLCQCAGRISADQIAPYPPGVPVIAPGEQITKKYLAYLDKVGYNINGIISILSADGSV